MPPAVVMAPVVTRSSLELMLELVQKRDELPKDAPPALPSRPTSRGRLPSSRGSLPLNFKTRNISPEPSVKGNSDKMEMKEEPIFKVDKEFPAQNRFFGSHNKLKKVDQSEDSSSYVNKPQAESCDEENSGEIGRLIYQMSGSEKVVDKILTKTAESEDASYQALLQIIGVEKCSNGVHACSSYEDLKKGAITFQSFVRGEIARRTFQFLMKRRAAVVIIQKYGRRWIARTKFFNQKEDIIHLQALVRGQLAQKQSIILKNLRISNKLNEASSNWHLHKNFQETKEYALVHHSVMEDLQMRVLKAEASLREKEEIHLSFQHQLEQYEMKMILMEEMWQKKMSLQDLNERHFEAHHSVKTELQRQILKTKGALMQKEEENIKLQQELHQYEIKWSQYEVKMKSMEEKWQKQLTSLQLSLAAARKRLLADDSASLPERSDSSSLWHSYDSESSMSNEARSPESTLAKHPHASGPGTRTDFTRKQKAVNVLVQEFEQRKQAFEDGARFLMEAKSQQLDRSLNPDVELQKLKIEFASWKKDYKVRLREAKSAIHKLSKTRKEKPRKNWWCTGIA